MNIPRRAAVALSFAAILLTSFVSVLAETEIEDITPPRIVSASIEPSVINTSYASATLTLTVHMTDDLSGADYVVYVFRPTNPNVSGQQAIVSAYRREEYQQEEACTGTPTNVVCEMPFSLPQYSAGGLWAPIEISTIDALGNRGENPISGYVTFFNDTEGTGPPQPVFLPIVTR